MDTLIFYLLKFKMNIFITVFITIFSVINPFGTIPVFLSLTTDLSKSETTKVSYLTSIYVMLILFIAFFLGKYLLYYFGISIESLKIGGGIVIASSGFSLLTGSFIKHKGMKKKYIEEELQTKSEIAFTPLAIPMLAGPGTIAMLIDYRSIYQTTSETILVCIALILICIAVFIILYFSKSILKFLGSSGLNALSRIIGFFLIAMGVELIYKTLLIGFKI